MNELCDFGIAEGSAPEFLESHHFRAMASSHFGHSVAEKSVGQHPHFHARFDKIADGGFHSTAARSGDDEGPLIFCAKNVAQHAHSVLGNLEEVRIKVAHHR